jgi:hypothetical protein
MPELKLGIGELGYVEKMRQRLGLEEDDPKKDHLIIAMTPMQRVRLIAGYVLGDSGWADEFKDYFESQGLFLTTNPDADGVLKD